MSPPSWQSLLLPVKQLIVKELDYKDRCNLKLCSKEDKLLVESVRYAPKLIQFEKQLEKIILRYEHVEKTFGNLSDAQKFIGENWIKNGVIEAEEVRVLNIPLSPMWAIKCAHLELRMLGKTLLPLWLEKVVPKLKTLKIMDSGIDRTIMDTEQVKTTTDFLRLSRDVDISDEQLEQFQSSSLVLISNIESDVFLTENGVKKAFKKFIENARPGNEFEIKYPKKNRLDHRNVFDKSWIVDTIEHGEEDEAIFLYRIVGGFTNAHGIKQFPEVVVFEFSDRFVLKVS